MTAYVMKDRNIRRRGILAGQGYIAGVAPGLVTVEGVPAARDIVLMRRDEHTVLARTTSKADGTYSFKYLSIQAIYLVYAWDRYDQLNAVIVDRVTPALMPEFGG